MTPPVVHRYDFIMISIWELLVSVVSIRDLRSPNVFLANLSPELNVVSAKVLFFSLKIFFTWPLLPSEGCRLWDVEKSEHSVIWTRVDVAVACPWGVMRENWSYLNLELLFPHPLFQRWLMLAVSSLMNAATSTGSSLSHSLSLTHSLYLSSVSFSDFHFSFGMVVWECISRQYPFAQYVEYCTQSKG